MMTKSTFHFVNIILVLLSYWKLGHCKEYTLNGPKGNVTSQNYPNGYPKDYSTWTITVQSGQQIRLVIKDLNFAENCASCDCDTVVVYDSSNSDPWSQLGEFCTSIAKLPKVLVSTGRTMEIDFDARYRRKAGRGLWFYYEAVSSTTAKVDTISVPTTYVAPLATDRPTSGTSNLSAVQSTVLAVAVVLTVFITVSVIFVCGIKRRLARRRSPSSPQPSTDPTQETSIETFDQFGDHPPSYEEALRSSHSNMSIPPPPPYTAEPDGNCPQNESPAPQTSVAIECSQTNEAYDTTGLPTYAEARRLSQDSLDRA